MALLQKAANRQLTVVEVQLSDLAAFFTSSRDMAIVERVRINTSRYISLLAQVCDEKMPPPSVEFDGEEMSTYEVTMQQRRFNQQ